MIPGNLNSMLAGRKKFVDQYSEISIGTGVSLSSNGDIGGTDSKYTAKSFIDKSASGYTGLINQGATCYLNSLLQSLYMIPEFRLSAFNYNENESRDVETIDHYESFHESLINDPINKSNILLQIQILFANLQLSRRGAISTNALTQSFGFTSQDAFTQQDAQECMAVIFGHILSHPTSSIANFISKSWTGELHDRLQCNTCGKSRGSVNIFHDLQLQVAKQDTIENSLSSFILDEVIEDVECSSCDIKGPHNKGVRIRKLPYILSLQLVRFDFNWATMQKFKVSDALSFGLELNMRPFMDPVPDSNTEEGTTDSVSGEEEYNYELIAVLLHIGSAFSGHYSCYLRDVSSCEEGKWLLFNDSNVTAVDDEHIALAFSAQDTHTSSSDKRGPSCDIEGLKTHAGATLGGGGGISSSFKNAYMLIYRQKSSENLSFVGNDFIPAYLRSHIEKENEIYVKQKDEFDYEKSFLYIKITHEKELKSIKIHNSASVKDLTDMAWNSFFHQINNSTNETSLEFNNENIYDNEICRERIRLREFDSVRGVLLGPLAKRGEESIALSTLSEKTLRRNLYIEVKPLDSEDFADDATDLIPIEFVIYSSSENLQDLNKFVNHFSQSFAMIISSNKSIKELIRLCYINYVQSMNDNLPDRNGNDPSDIILSHAALCTVDIQSGVATTIDQNSDITLISFIKPGERLYLDFDSYETLESNGDINPRLKMVDFFDKMYNEIKITFQVFPSFHEAASSSIPAFDSSSVTRGFEIPIDQRLPLEALKQRIAENIHLDLNLFSLHKSISGKPGPELKDLTISLLQSGFNSEVTSISVVLSTPLRPDQFRVIIFYKNDLINFEKRDIESTNKNSQMEGQSNSVIDSCAIAEFLMKLEVSVDEPIPSIKNRIIEALAISPNFQATYNPVHLHSRLRLCTLLESSATASASEIIDVRNIDGLRHLKTGQVLKEPTSQQQPASKLLKDDLLLLFEYDLADGLGDYTDEHLWLKLCFWDTENNALSKPLEIPVLKSCTFLQLKKLVSEIPSWQKYLNTLFNDEINFTSSCENLHLVKPFAWQLKDCSVLPTLKWSSQPKDSDVLEGAPWRLKDNALLLFRDAKVPIASEAGSGVVDNTAGNSMDRETGFKVYTRDEQRVRAEAEAIENAQRKILMEEKMQSLLRLKMQQHKEL